MYEQASEEVKMCDVPFGFIMDLPWTVIKEREPGWISDDLLTRANTYQMLSRVCINHL